MSDFEAQVQTDYEDIISKVSLRVEDEVADLLLMQSVIGHAQNKHGKFVKAYPNATLDDIAIALEVDPVKIRRERQGIIDSIAWFTTEIMIHSNYEGYVDNKGAPLLSLTIPLELDDPAATLKGIYLASVMDSFGWRTKAASRYNFDIGRGECIALDIGSPNFKMMGYTLEDLSEGEWSDNQIKSFEDMRIIIPETTTAVTNKVISAYIRRKKGKGTSDDLAMVLAGKLYGKDAAIGVFLGDAIDTWDKYAEVLIPGGQDEFLGKLIKDHEDSIKGTYPGFELPSEEEVLKFIYTIALQKNKSAISNSQRYLLQVDRSVDQCAVESHLNYIEGKDYKKMKFRNINKSVMNHELYSLFEKRFKKNYQCK